MLVGAPSRPHCHAHKAVQRDLAMCGRTYDSQSNRVRSLSFFLVFWGLIRLNQVKYTTPGRFNPENPVFANKMLFTFSNFHKHNLCIQISKSSILPLKVKRGNDFNPNIKTHNQILVLVNRIKKPSEGKKRQVPWLDLGRQPESSLA